MRLACLSGQPYAGSQQPYVSQQAMIFVRGICISKPLASLQAYPGTGQYSAAGQQAMLCGARYEISVGEA